MKRIFFLSCILFYGLSQAQVKSGPMLGYNTMKEVLVWIQTEDVQDINFSWKAEDMDTWNEKFYQSSSEKAFTVEMLAEPLEPGTAYEYKIQIEDKTIKGKFKSQELWQHRKEPPAFAFATGSCVYSNEEKYDRPGEPYGKSLAIFKHIVEKKPDLMLWLGDNIYLREPDWTSWTGIIHRYNHFRSQAELTELWKSMHHYAIWDDHDYGPNDGDRSFINKNLSLEAFKLFWPNPSFGMEEQDGIYTQFSYLDADFFLLDNRWNRSPNTRKTGERQILGEKQIQWLIDALVNSQASFKFVAIGGQLLSPAAVYENHATYAVEREKIIRLIEEEKIKNVIFLSGDRHKTELSKLQMENGNSLYDFTCSPLTSKAYDTSDEGNTLRVEGTHVSSQNFGLLNLSGTFDKRLLSISVYDSSGKLLWERLIPKE